MRLPQVKGCGRFPLEVGAYFFSWLQIVCAFSYVVSTLPYLKIELEGSSDGDDTTPDSDVSPHLSRKLILLSSHITCGVIQLCYGLSLYITTRYVVRQNTIEFPYFLTAAVIFGIIDICLFLPMIIIQSSFWLIDGLITSGIVLLIFLPFIIALKFYMLVVVSSFRKRVFVCLAGETSIHHNNHRYNLYNNIYQVGM